MRRPRSRLRVAAFVGLAAWSAMLASGRFAEIGETLVGLAIAFVVPLGVALSIERDDVGAEAMACGMLPFASAMGLVALVVPKGPLSGMLASGWLLGTIAAAIAALSRLAHRGVGPIEELAIDAGHLYLPVGAAWLCASRAELPLLGFHEPIVLYTADHFHFAGFAAPLAAGLTGREVGLRRAVLDDAAPIASRFVRRATSLSLGVVVAGVPLVAAGIVVSHTFELPAAILLGAGMLVLASLLVTRGLARVSKRDATGALLVVAGASLVLSMSLVLVFTTTGSATRGAGAPFIAYSTMAAVHGLANAVGFASCALVAYAFRPPPSRSGPFGGAFPKLFGDGFIGPDFFRRVNAIDEGRAVRGQLASLDAFAHAGFHPDRVDPAVRAFYERTADFELAALPTWYPPFRAAGKLFAWFARRFLGQLELPTRPESEEVVSTELFALRDDVDGRRDARGYVRTYGEGPERRANYVAAYATHASAHLLHLSCAFPLPFSSLVAVLRFDDGDSPGGLALSSHPRSGVGPSDEGMFLVTRFGALRLPVDETIVVEAAGGELRARHETQVLGLRCFTLAYRIHAGARVRDP